MDEEPDIRVLEDKEKNDLLLGRSPNYCIHQEIRESGLDYLESNYSVVASLENGVNREHLASCHGESKLELFETSNKFMKTNVNPRGTGKSEWPGLFHDKFPVESKERNEFVKIHGGDKTKYVVRRYLSSCIEKLDQPTPKHVKEGNKLSPHLRRKSKSKSPIIEKIPLDHFCQLTPQFMESMFDKDVKENYPSDSITGSTCNEKTGKYLHREMEPKIWRDSNLNERDSSFNESILKRKEKYFVNKFKKRSRIKRCKGVKKGHKFKPCCKKNNCRSTLFEESSGNNAERCRKILWSENLNLQDIEQVLGMRLLDNGDCNILVQFKDDTSNWLEKGHLKIIKNHVVDYFFYSPSAIHRLPFSVYYRHDTPHELVWPNCSDKIHKSETLFDQDHDIFEKNFLSGLSLTNPNGICHSIKSNFFSPINVYLQQKRDKSKQLGYKKVISHNPLSSEKCFGKIGQNTNKVCHYKVEELEMIDSGFTEIFLRHKDNRSKTIRTETCDNLIQQLEMKSVDKDCPCIVINGLEEYFASSMDLEEILKLTSDAECNQYNKKITTLRYLFQTLKNHPKPIIAVIKSAATGLAASVLSLVDIVYDQFSHTAPIKSLNGRQISLPVLMPKLMGLLPKNEALLMGEIPTTLLGSSPQQLEQIYKQIKFSDCLDKTLKEMKINERLCSNMQFLKKGLPLRSLRTTHPLDPCYNSEIAEPPKADIFQKKFGEQNNVHPKQSLNYEIKQARDIAISCLRDLADFWKEVVQAEV